MKIFVIGGSGLVGGNCLDHFETLDKVTAVGTHMGYPTDRTVYFNTLELEHPDNYDLDAFQPDVIVHCGALTWVDYCEENPEESYLKTVQSAKEAIRLCKKYGARLVYTSTDYVFDGTQGPYREEDVVNPLNVYGRHKLEAEQLVLQEVPGSLVLRITNVYGNEIRGKNFVARLVKQLQAGVAFELQLPYDQYATPVNAYDIARMAYRLLADKKSGIYGVASTDFLNRYHLAHKVVRHFGANNVTLTPIDTPSLNQAATRPLIGGFVGLKFATEYPEFAFTSINDYLNQEFPQ